MRYLLKHSIPLFIFIILCLPGHARLHDFDSLVQHSVNFKEYIDSIKDTFDIFNEDEILNVTFRSDFRNLIKKKLHDEYQPAVLEIIMFDSVKVKWDLKIRPRGEFRRTGCNIPPIKLNFSKEKAIFRQFEEFDKVKFVGNCKSGDLFDVYLVEEYYIYKMYNLLTPFGYRVRLMKVNYIDTSGRKKPWENYAFIMESTDQMATRLNGVSFERKGLSSKMIDGKMAAVMDIFQFLIGNTDYNLSVLHNIKLLKIADENFLNPVAVPFDFDYCGLINAYYAVPDENLPIEYVRERFFLGACRDIEAYTEIFQVLRDKREEMEALFINSKYLSEKAKRGPLTYLEEFYKIINSEATVKYYILNNCY